MSKQSSRRLPSDRRPARRSLVDLTAVATRAVQEDLPATTPGVIATGERPRAVEPEATTAAQGAEPVSNETQTLDNTAELAVQIAKELQTGALEDFKRSMNAALDYARDLVDTRTPKSDGASRRDDQIVASLGAAVQYRAEAFALLKANLETALDYANEVARARTTAEFVELSSEQARKQCEFVLKQTGALKSLARAVTKSDPS
jgi:hypothetical protein